MGVYGDSLTNRRMILLAALSLIASLLAVGFNAPAANALSGDATVTLTATSSSTANESGTVDITAEITAIDTLTAIPVELSIDLVRTGGVATNPADYTRVDSAFVWAAGSEVGDTDTITITIELDTIDEGASEVVNFALQNAPTGTTLIDSTYDLTITDDDDPPTISIADNSFAEAGTASFTVTREDTDTTGDITFTYTTSGGTATEDIDYTGTTSTGTITPGAPGTTTVTVPISTDVIDESDEEFTVTLSGLSGNATFSDEIATGTITDDDDPPTISIADNSFAEAGTASFTVTREDTDTTGDITFTYTTSGGTATEDIDYTGTTSTGTITPGAPGTTTVTVPITPDVIDESNEEFTVTLSGLSGNATFSDEIATGTILDDDGSPTISVTSFSVNENAGTADVVVTRSGTDTVAAITFDYATADGTATAGALLDYVDTDGTGASIAPGAPGTTTIQVPINQDDIDEGNETFTFTISNVSANAGLGNAVATVTITDDVNDIAGVTVAPTAVTALEGGTNGTYTVELNSEPTHDVTITLVPVGTQATAEATADPGNDELTFTPANWDQPQSVSVIADDDDVDDDGIGETIGHTGASTDPNYAGTFANVDVTITDNDIAGVTVTPISVSATEGGTNGTYTVELNSEPTSSVTININESSGEFSTSPTSLVFTAGNWFTERTVNVIANDDGIADGTTTGTITHSASSGDGNYNGGAVTISPVGVTIIDDETPGISISGSPLATEGGANGTYTVVLTTMPSGPVSVALSATSGAGEFTIVTASPLTFTTGDYDQPQPVTVAAVNDDVIDGAQAGTINHVATGGGYNVADPQNVSVTVDDNDVAGATVVESGGTTVVEEGGATDTYTVVLTAEPKANVTVSAVPDAQVDVTPLARTFTPANWNVPQTFTVAGKSDGIDELPTHPGSVQHATTSSDPDFDALAVDTVIASVTDVDELLVTIDGPTFGAPGESSVFTAMVNAGATGTITYDWTVFFEGNPIANGDESTFQFTPSSGGLHIVRALVGDDQGQNPAVFIQFTSLGDIAGNVFVDDIIWLAEEGITRGCNPPANDLFCPGDTVTRGQMAAFLVRFLGLTAIDSSIAFNDTAGNIFENDILKLATAGITRGCNVDGTAFCPNDGVTRGQMAAFLVRAFSLTDNGGGDLFTDDDTSIFEDDIDKLATAKITLGCNPPANTQFCPTLTVTRGQMAAFLHRADGLLP